MIYLLTHLGEQTNHISARHKLNIPSPPFSWTKNEGGNDQGGALLPDIIIGGELWTNILLSLACVVVITFLLLCNLTVCLTVVTMVTMTLTNVVGYLHYWDSTIDIISCIGVVLSIGLSVDYSVHIGHSYLVAKGEFSDDKISGKMMWIAY